MAEPTGTKITEVFLDDWDPESGSVRTQAQDEQAREDKGNYSTVYYLVHEVHGRFEQDKGGEDNASLIVIKIQPNVKNPDHNFVWFKVTLRCEKTKTTDDQPYFTGADPALGGKKTLGDFIINKSISNTYGLSLDAKAAPIPVALGGNLSRTKTDAYVKHEKDTIQAQLTFSRMRLAVNDTAWWELQASSTSGQGIGDYVTVALVVHRGRGQQFTIIADTEAKLDSFSDKLQRPFRKKEGTQLGTYGPAPEDLTKQTIPEGIDPKKLKTSTDDPDVVRNSLRVGVHVPESEDPLTTKAPPAPASEAIPAMVQVIINPASPTITGKPTAVEEVQVKSSNSGAVATPDPPKPQPVLSPLVEITTEPEKIRLENMKTEEIRPEEENRYPQPQQRTADTRKTTSSPAPAREVDVPPISQTQFGSLNSRADRHLKMAALYQRLAQLHMEEATESLAQDADAYADEAENMRWRLVRF